MSRELTREEKNELMEKARDLNSKDDGKRQAAEKAFDDKLGKEAREKIQEEIKNRKDESEKGLTPKQIDDLQNKIDDVAKKDAGKKNGLTKEDIESLAKKAGDLNSMDETKRKEAEKALDDALGRDAREELQKEMKKQASTGQKGPIDLKKQIEDEMRRQRSPADPPLPAMEDDPRNRAKTAQLQLEEFEKNRYNNDLHERLGWKPGEYEEFLRKTDRSASSNSTRKPRRSRSHSATRPRSLSATPRSARQGRQGRWKRYRREDRRQPQRPGRRAAGVRRRAGQVQPAEAEEAIGWSHD